MKKAILMILASAAFVMAQSIAVIPSFVPAEKAHQYFQSTYDLTLASTSNAMINIAAGAYPVAWGFNLFFMASTSDSVPLDVTVYRNATFTNGTTPITTNQWIPTYTTGTLVSGYADPKDLNNMPYYPISAQPVGTWIKSLAASGFAAAWTQMTNLGRVENTYYMIAATLGTRQVQSFPAPYILKPNANDFIVISNRTAAASNAVVRITIASFVQR